MPTYKVDNKRRLTLPNSNPGEVYDVEYRGAGSYRLTRLVRQAETEDVTEQVEPEPVTEDV